MHWILFFALLAERILIALVLNTKVTIIFIPVYFTIVIVVRFQERPNQLG